MLFAAILPQRPRARPELELGNNNNNHNNNRHHHHHHRLHLHHLHRNHRDHFASISPHQTIKSREDHDDEMFCLSFDAIAPLEDALV